MKKKIVINVIPTEKGWCGSIRGKTEKGSTEKIYPNDYYRTPQELISNLSSESNLAKIEQWMEQIQ